MSVGLINSHNLYFKIPYFLVDTYTSKKRRYAIICYIYLRYNLHQITVDGYKTTISLEHSIDYCNIPKSKKNCHYKQFYSDFVYVCNLFLKNFNESMLKKCHTYYIKHEYISMFDFSYDTASPYIKIPLDDLFEIMNIDVAAYERKIEICDVLNILCLFKTRTLSYQKQIEYFSQRLNRIVNVYYHEYTYQEKIKDETCMNEHTFRTVMNVIKSKNMMLNDNTVKINKKGLVYNTGQVVAFIYGERIYETEVMEIIKQKIIEDELKKKN